MPVTARHFTLVVGLGLLCAWPVSAQTAIAHLSAVEGTVTRLHRFAPAAATRGVVLVEGDQIVTAVGRAELSFVDGSTMHLDHHTQVAIVGVARIRLIDGRVSLRTTTAYTAETMTGTVHVLPQGVFELTAAAANRDVLIRVTEGEARIQSPSGAASVSATETAFVSGTTGHAFITPWVHVQRDAFMRWGHARYVLLPPPPTFLPYAHPAYRQAAYDRLLHKGGRARLRGGARLRGDHQNRVERRRGRGAPRAESGIGGGREARPRATAPAAPAPKPARAAIAGKVIRQP